MNRRQFLTGLSTLIAAPAIIKVASVMPVKVMEPLIVVRDWPYREFYLVRHAMPSGSWRSLSEGFLPVASMVEKVEVGLRRDMELRSDREAWEIGKIKYRIGV